MLVSALPSCVASGRPRWRPALLQHILHLLDLEHGTHVGGGAIAGAVTADEYRRTGE